MLNSHKLLQQEPFMICKPVANIVRIVPAGDLVIQGAIASAGMILTQICPEYSMLCICKLKDNIFIAFDVIDGYILLYIMW